jgi:chaperonin GroEL
MQSAGADAEVGRLLAEALRRVGPTGIVQVEASSGVDTELVVDPGMQLDEGYLSPYFVTDPERLECVFDAPLLFVTAREVESVHELVPALEVAAATSRPLVVVAESLSDDVLSMLITNRVRGSVEVCAVSAPGYGERRRAALSDIAALGDGRCVNDDAGDDPTKLGPADLGSLRRAVIGRERSLLTADDRRARNIESYVDGLRRARAAADRAPERSQLDERIARLESCHAILRVGAGDLVSLSERTGRVEDAVAATRAALEEGVVIGGGVAFLRALGALDGVALSDDEAIGRRVLTEALCSPASQIASNAGHDGGEMVARILESEAAHGFDAERGELADLAARGILDPVKVTRVALEQAVSISGAILTTEGLITDRPNADDQEDV